MANADVIIILLVLPKDTVEIVLELFFGNPLNDCPCNDLIVHSLFKF